MGTKRIIDLWFDVTIGKLRASDGAELAENQYPIIFYRERPIVNLRLVTGYDSEAGTFTAYTGLGPGGAWPALSASIANDFSHVAMMCKTTAAGINVAGDWGNGGNADLANGEVSIRLDANTSTFATAVGTSEFLNDTQLELQAWVQDGGDTVLGATFRLPIIAHNLQDSGQDVPPAPPQDYLTETESDARYTAMGHPIDSPNHHAGVSGAVEGDIVVFDANGLPADGGVPVSSIPSASTDLSDMPAAPTLGNTLVRRHVGDADVWQDEPATDTDEKVKADADDPTPGTLEDKVDDTTLEVDTENHVMRVKNNGVALGKLAQVATDVLLGRSTAETGNVETVACTAAGRAILSGATAAAQRTTLGLGAGDAPLFKRAVSASTSEVTIAEADTRKAYTNEGATAEVNHVLPGAAAGLTYTFVCQDADGLKITAAAGDTVRIGNSVSSSGGYASTTTIGSAVTLLAINATEWMAIASVGTWATA